MVLKYPSSSKSFLSVNLNRRKAALSFIFFMEKFTSNQWRKKIDVLFLYSSKILDSTNFNSIIYHSDKKLIRARPSFPRDIIITFVVLKSVLKSLLKSFLSLIISVNSNIPNFELLTYADHCKNQKKNCWIYPIIWLQVFNQ